jgi:hypothetical protein
MNSWENFKKKLLSKKTKPKIKKQKKDIRPGPNMVCLTNLHGPGN